MQTITTKYVKPTEQRDPRILAKTDGAKVSIPYPNGLDVLSAHAKAAIELCRKLNWHGELIPGSNTKNGYVFVLTDDCKFSV